MLLAWAVLAMWICGCLIWIVLLVITLQLPQGSSSTSCAAGKAHPCCCFPPQALRSLWDTRRPDPKADGVKGKVSSKVKGLWMRKAPGEDSSFHNFTSFPLSSSCLCGWCLHSWRTPGQGLLFGIQKLSFLGYFSFGIFSALKIERKNTLSESHFSWFAWFLPLLEERNCFGLWGRVRTLSQNAANYTSELLLKFHCLFWANAAALLQSHQAGHCWGFG